MLMLFFLYRFRFLLGPSLPRPPAYSRQWSPPGWVPPSCKAPLWSVFSYLATNRDHRSRAFSHTAVSSRRAAFRRHQPRNYSAQRSLSARLGDSFYFAECEIGESLLRRGARGLEGTALRGQRSLRRTGGASRHPVGACRWQTSSTALREWRLTKAKRTPAKHPTGAPRGGASRRAV